MGLGNDYLRGKSQCKPRKGQEGPTKTETPPGTVAAGPDQYSGCLPTGMRGHAKVIPRRTPVYQGGTKDPISISPTVPQGH
jgi:hypothetical protein